MQFRKCLLSVSAAMGIAGVAHATPPGGRFVEGREPNPVAREFYLTEPVPLGYAGSVPGEAPATGDWLGMGMMWGRFVDEYSMPLGTAPMHSPVWY